MDASQSLAANILVVLAVSELLTTSEREMRLADECVVRSAMGTRRLRVAVVDEELPYPLTSGKRIRTWNLLSRLAERHDVTYLAHAHADHDEQEQAEQALREAGIEPRVVDPVVPRKSGWKFYARLAANLASSQPYIVASNCTAPLRKAVIEAAARESFDLWHFEWTPLADLAEHVGGTPWVVSAHNVETLIWQRYQLHERNLLKRAYIAEQARKLRRFERAVFRTATRVVTVSAADATLAARFQARSPAVVDNGVDLSYFAELPIARESSARERNTLLFLGSLDWRPNQDAIGWLLDEIWPEMQRANRSLRLEIVGRRPPHWLRDRIREASGVTLAADVADVRPYLARATAMIVPLRIGGGSRLKILEALASGLPVVSTTIGAEGLHLTSGRELLIADSPAEIIASVSKLVGSAELCRDLSDAGRKAVVNHYDWEPLARRLETVWHEAVQ